MVCDSIKRISGQKVSDDALEAHFGKKKNPSFLGTEDVSNVHVVSTFIV